MVAVFYRILKFAYVAFVFLAVCSGQLQADLIYDSTTDFVAGSPNPNGVWQYGYQSTLDGTFVPFAEYGEDATTFRWFTNISLGTPTLFKVTSGSQSQINAGEAALHGGPNGEFAVLRFVAPSALKVDVVASYGPGDTGNTDAYLYFNGVQLDSVSSTLTAGNFNAQGLNLAVNDTLDLIVGTGGDGFTFDSTPVNLNIQVVPEPSSLALLAPCLALALARRRRSSAYEPGKEPL